MASLCCCFVVIGLLKFIKTNTNLQYFDTKSVFFFLFFSKEEFSFDRINVTVFTAFKLSVFRDERRGFWCLQEKQIPLTFAVKGLINALLTFSSFHCRYLDRNKLSDITPDVFSELRNLKYV